MISGQFLFLFSALGAINGIFLAAYSFSRRPHRLANSVLGALLLAIGVRTAKSTFYFFNRDLAVQFLQIGLSACLLIGPLTYLYVHYHLADMAQRGRDRQWCWHLLPPLLLIAIGLLYPYSGYPIPWRRSALYIHIYWFCYLMAAGWKLWRARAGLREADGGVSRSTFLLLSVYFSSLLILACYVSTPMTSYIVGALSFTFSVHITVLVLMVRSEALRDPAKKEKYLHRKLPEQDASAIAAVLNQLMHEQKLYLNPNLSLVQLAKKAGSLQTIVSQVLNERLQKSFNLYVNEFRITEAKRILMEEPHLTLDMVAQRCGFNSNSTFFSAFKKLAGQTPASFRAACTPGN